MWKYFDFISSLWLNFSIPYTVHSKGREVSFGSTNFEVGEESGSLLGVGEHIRADCGWHPVWVRSSMPTSLLSRRWSQGRLTCLQHVTSGKCRRSFCTTYFYNARSLSRCVSRNSSYVSIEKDDNSSRGSRHSSNLSNLFLVVYSSTIDFSYSSLLVRVLKSLDENFLTL